MKKNSELRKCWLRISYNGSKFFGMAKQPGKITIQSEIESSLKKLFLDDIKITYAGRTDRGVHAFNQYICFDLIYDIDINSIKKYLNDNLIDIFVKDIWIEKNIDLHPRFSATEKIYEYKINNGEFNIITDNSLIYFVHKKIDFKLLESLSKEIVGKRNFASFTSKSDYENYIRTINYIDLSADKDNINIKISGDGFMRYMVRNIVGTMVAISTGQIDSTYLSKLLKEPDRGKAIYKAPSHGLYLSEVIYK